MFRRDWITSSNSSTTPHGKVRTQLGRPMNSIKESTNMHF